MSESKERTHEPAQEAESKIDIFELLYDYLRGLKKIWWLIPVLVCLFGGLLYARDVMRYQPMYKSQASFTVSTVTASGNSYSYSFYYDTSTVKQMASTFPYILESNLLIDLVKNDLGVEYINGAISASAIADSNLFTLTVTSSNPQDAYDILRAVINHYSEVSAYVIGDTQLNMIEAPKLAEAPYNKKNGFDSAVKGAAAGLLLAIILQLIYGKMRKTIRKEDEIKDVLNVQCLGVVPKVVFKKTPRCCGSGYFPVEQSDRQWISGICPCHCTSTGSGISETGSKDNTDYQFGSGRGRIRYFQKPGLCFCGNGKACPPDQRRFAEENR